MVYYIVPAILALLGVNIKNNKHDRKLYLVFSFVILWLLVALRGQTVGNDTITYGKEFLALVDSYDNFFIHESRFEYGYVLLCRFIGLFTHNIQIMYAVFGALTLIPVAITLYRYSERLGLSILLFSFNGFYFAAFSGIRVALCMAILLMAVKPLINRSPIAFIIWVLIASQFHNIGYIFLIMYPLRMFKFNTERMLCIIILGIIGLIAFPLIEKLIVMVFPQYEGYFDSDYSSQGFLGTLFNLVVYVAIMFLIFNYRTRYLKQVMRPRLKNDFVGECLPAYTAEEINIGKIFMLMLTVGLAFQFLEFRLTLIQRITSIFGNIIIVMIPYFGERIKTKGLKYEFYFITVFILIAKSAIVFILRPEWLNILPYSFFF